LTGAGEATLLLLLLSSTLDALSRSAKDAVGLDGVEARSIEPRALEGVSSEEETVDMVGSGVYAGRRAERRERGERGG